PFASSNMYIGEFARLAGTTPKAVRLYEQLGLLPEPRRRGKYRVYRAEDLEWVGFIREAQRLGCKLGELVPLLAGLTSLAEFPWQKVEQLIADKLAQIEAEVVRLQRQHQSLTQCAELLAQHPCRYGAPVPRYPESQLHQKDAGQAHKVA
ncbi:MerR family transcriptional regulator, partial [Aeromonas media]|uniref:MerR family transcriptional regulator n=1 Tax=Aeromonas media TaxID=651 RepID=UPI001F11EB6E